MSDFPTGDPSLDDIRISDAYIDALATSNSIRPQDRADAALASLLGGWRDEMRWPPANDLISEPQAIAALNAGLSETRKTDNSRFQRQTTGRSAPPARRGLSIVGALAAAALCLGGFGAVVGGAGPGDALYGVRTMLFGAPKQVRDDQVALATKTELQQVQELITQGDWEQAQQKLVAVSTQVATIEDGQQKEELLGQFNDLSAKVVERDPEATAPPGIIYTVPPSATELVPAVAPPPTSTPSAPPVSESTTPATSDASSSPVTSSAAPSSTPSPTSSPETSAQQSQATTTPTSAAPTTTTPTTTTPPTKATTSTTQTSTTQATTTQATTTQATTTQATTTQATTTTAAPAQATAPSTTAVATASPSSSAPAAAAQTTAAQTTAAQTTAAQTAAAETTTSLPAPKASQPVVTTTVVVPLPVPAG